MDVRRDTMKTTTLKAMAGAVVLTAIVAVSLRTAVHTHSSQPVSTSAHLPADGPKAQYVCATHGQTKMCSMLEIGTQKDDVVLALGVGAEQQDTFENATVTWLRYTNGTLLMFRDNRLAAISAKQ
jgi:hypothetical protein